MNTLSKNLFVLLGLLSIFYSCSKEEDIDVVPGSISNFSAKAQNQSILLEWGIPSDTDLDKLTLKYDGKEVDLLKTDTHLEIENLTNKVEYTFDITVVDLAGQESTVATVKATPDQYVKVYKGLDFLSGYYEIQNTYLTTGITIDGDKYKRVLSTTSGNKFIWEGTLKENSNATFTYNYEYYGMPNNVKDHVANMEVITNAVFCFELEDAKTRFANSAYEKIEGDSDFIEGKYRLIKNTTSSDRLDYNEMLEEFIEYKSNGDVIWTSRGRVNVTAWTNQDLLDNKIIFVNYKSKNYVINNPKNYVVKQ